MSTWTWENRQPGTGIWGTLDFMWELILLHWHCRQDLDQEPISLDILGQTKREEINLREPRTPGWVVECSRSNSFRLREKGTRGLGTPVETSHLTSMVPYGTDTIWREQELSIDWTELHEDWREANSSKLKPETGVKSGAGKTVLTQPDEFDGVWVQAALNWGGKLVELVGQDRASATQFSAPGMWTMLEVNSEM